MIRGSDDAEAHPIRTSPTGQTSHICEPIPSGISPLSISLANFPHGSKTELGAEQSPWETDVDDIVAVPTGSGETLISSAIADLDREDTALWL
jgi:hypothetical protein